MEESHRAPIFRQPSQSTFAEVVDAIDRGDPNLAEKLVGLALNSDEPDTVLSLLAKPQVLNSDDEGVRGIAVLCIGHLARIFGELPKEPVIIVLRSALKDCSIWVRANYDSAISDLKTFAPEMANAICKELGSGSGHT